MVKTLMGGALGAGLVTTASEVTGPAYRASLVVGVYQTNDLVIANGGTVDPEKTTARVDAIRDSGRTILGDCITRVGEIKNAISGSGTSQK